MPGAHLRRSFLRKSRIFSKIGVRKSCLLLTHEAKPNSKERPKLVVSGLLTIDTNCDNHYQAQQWTTPNQGLPDGLQRKAEKSLAFKMLLGQVFVG